MKIVLVAELLLLGVFVMNLADQDTQGAVSVCDTVRRADDECVRRLDNPVPEFRKRVFELIQTYVDSLDQLIDCIKRDKSDVLTHCKDIVDDKPRGSRYMAAVTFDYHKLMDGFQWNQTDMMDLLLLRRATMDKWVEIDKLLD